MLSVVIPTHNCERALVPTLAMLVPGVMASAIREVIVADGGSSDATGEVVDVAGCTMMTSAAPLGPRLRAAAAAARGDWLMFLRPGSILDAGWIAETVQFVDAVAGGDVAAQAAVFRRSPGTARRRTVMGELTDVLRASLSAPGPDQGLVVSRRLYERAGGHRDEPDAETAFLRRLGGRRLAQLRAGIATRADILFS